MFEVIAGGRKGLFGIAYNHEQEEAIWKLGKLQAHFFQDMECRQKPQSFAHTGMISKEFIKQIGFTD